MLATTIITLSARLTDHLKRFFRIDEDIVSLQPVTSAMQSSPTNKVHMFPVNIERETLGGTGFGRQAVLGGYYRESASPWLLNVYVLIAAVFSDKQYVEGLRLMGGVATFLQTNNSFVLPQTGVSIGMEPVNLSFQELSNVWSVCGGMYYPSLLCKLRNLMIDGNEIHRLGRIIKEGEGHVGNL
jgi:hypothetical protein